MYRGQTNGIANPPAINKDRGKAEPPDGGQIRQSGRCSMQINSLHLLNCSCIAKREVIMQAVQLQR